MIGKSSAYGGFSKLLLGAGVALLGMTWTLQADDKPAINAIAVPPASAPATSPATPPTTREKNWDKTKEAKKEEDVAKVMEFFSETQRDVYDQAQTLRKSDPTRFEELVHKAVPTVNRLEALKKKSPKRYELSIIDLRLNYEAQRLARQITSRPDISPDERDKLTKQLAAKVSEQFDNRQLLRQQEIEDLKKQVDDLNKQLSELDKQIQINQKNKDNIIKTGVKELIEKPTPKIDL